MTCPDPLNAVYFWTLDSPDSIAVSWYWTSNPNTGAMSFGVFENSPPVSAITIQFKDSNGWLWRSALTSALLTAGFCVDVGKYLQVVVTVNTVYRGIPTTRLASYPPSIPALDFYSGPMNLLCFGCSVHQSHSSILFSLCLQAMWWCTTSPPPPITRCCSQRM